MFLHNSAKDLFAVDAAQPKTYTNILVMHACSDFSLVRARLRMYQTNFSVHGYFFDPNLKKVSTTAQANRVVAKTLSDVEFPQRSLKRRVSERSKCTCLLCFSSFCTSLQIRSATFHISKRWIRQKVIQYNKNNKLWSERWLNNAARMADLSNLAIRWLRKGFPKLVTKRNAWWQSSEYRIHSSELSDQMTNAFCTAQ